MEDQYDENISNKIIEENEDFKSIRELIKKSLCNNTITPYYPLPSNDGYEKFLQSQKKEQYQKTQYSIHYLLSLRKKYQDKPITMKEIKLPYKNEVSRARAKILTDEAFRETRNYLDNGKEIKNNDTLDVYASLLKKKVDNNTEKNLGELYAKTSELREILNKISQENFSTHLNTILKYDYSEELLEVFKNLLYVKIVTERQYRKFYIDICLEMFKMYNKKTYEQPGMNFKTIMLKKCQEEFYNSETKIEYSGNLDADERKAYLTEIKFGNIKLISEFFLKSVIQLKVISDCIDYLINNASDLNIRLLCELIKKICIKLYDEDPVKLEKVAIILEDLYLKPDIDTKTKFFILDCLDLKKISWGIRGDHYTQKSSQLNDLLTNTTTSSIRRTSIDRGSRKGSLNPTQVDYLRRSRFNSRADELKCSKLNNQDLMNELVTNLGADIQFYQCFKLTEEEFSLVSKAVRTYIKEWVQKGDFRNVINDFYRLIDEVPCEKFIAVGHILEIMFSKNTEDANAIREILLFFYDNKVLDGEDIKHGIVLGLVNFRDNMIDYPNSKSYLKEFLSAITKKEIIEQKLQEVYEKCCNNIEKFLF